MNSIEQNLADNNLSLPELKGSNALFSPYVLDGNYIYVSGQLPLGFGSLEETKGQLGDTITIEHGQKIAKYCALNLLAQVKQACNGDLSKIKKCVKITVFVNSTTDFTDQPMVANGASEVINKAFGFEASHARSAIGVSQLPSGVAVEVEGIFKIE